MDNDAPKPSPQDIDTQGFGDPKPPTDKERIISNALKTGYSELRTWDDGAATDRRTGFLGVYQTGVRKYYANFGIYFENVDAHTPLKGATFSPETFTKGWDQTQFIKWLNGQGIHEALVMAPFNKYEKKTRIVNKGNLLRAAKTEDYYELAGQKTVREAVGYGQEEPAVIISYRAVDRLDGKLPQSARYRGRPGNFLDMQFIVPAEIAAEIAENIDKEPTFIRELVEAFVQNKYPQKFIDGHWNLVGRPPWEVWDGQPESKMYFANAGKPNTQENPNWKILSMK
ncbi:MAG: hypothetical protein HYT83_02705 [Candidatus Levybacteria bacterium]|nr:hypothetical protein [Candidatus Levybacteria bacterium]